MPHPMSAMLSAQADGDAVLFLRIRHIVRMTGLGRSTIYRMVAEQRFPQPVRLGKRAVAWRRSDLDAWSQGRPRTMQ